MVIYQKTFLELTNEQLYEILKLRLDIFIVEQDCPYPELDNKDQTAVHFFIEKSDVIIAYLRVYFKNDRLASIGRIVCHKAHRGQGHVPELIREAIRYLNDKCDLITMQAQQALEKYYRRFGFEPISTPYEWDGIMHIDMRLKVK